MPILGRTQCLRFRQPRTTPGERSLPRPRDGSIYWQSNHADLSDTLPDAIGYPDRNIAIPHKTDLGLGKPLTLQFTAQYLPAQLDQVRELFSHPHAAARFKELLVDQQMLSAWHTVEQNWCDSDLRQWCAEHGVALQD